MNAPYRVVLSENTTSSLRSLTQKTGLSANLLARFAMLISFEMPDPIVPEGGKPGLTINRTTLFGDLEAFLMTAFALSGGKATEPGAARELSGHISRGVAFLNLRAGSMTELISAILESPDPDTAKKTYL
jgi:DNA sulfur modification protein DndE